MVLSLYLFGTGSIFTFFGQKISRKFYSTQVAHFIRVKNSDIINTHCDFLIWSKLNKEILMVVQVDGSQNKEEIQAKRDRRKDRLLMAAGVKILCLSKTTIECKEKIIKMLKHI